MMMMMMMIIIIIIIIICDYEKGTCMLIDVTVPGDRNVIKKEAEMILRYKDHTVEIQRMRNVKAEMITSYNMGDWNHFEITRTVPEQHTGKARN